MATSLTFNYAHSWTDIEKGADQNGAYYEVTYVILGDWQKDGDTAVNELVGYSQGPSTLPVYYPAHQYPLSTNLFCVSARVVEGIGQPILNANGYPSFDTGFVVKARYQAWPWSPYGSTDPTNTQGIDQPTLIPYCTQDLDFELDTQGTTATTSGGWTWASDGKPVTLPMQLRSWTTVMTLTFHQVPFLNSPLIRQLRGCVNSVVFLGGAVGCILFRGARSSLGLQTNGSYARQIQLVLVERNVPWNQINRSTTGDGKPDTPLDGNGNPFYTVADLTPLLGFGPGAFFSGGGDSGGGGGSLQPPGVPPLPGGG